MRIATVCLTVVLLGGAFQALAENVATGPAPTSAPATTVARPQVEATLALAKKAGFVTISVKNVTDAPLVLADIPEGAGDCDKYWQAEVVVEDVTLKQALRYAPALTPFRVTIKPGETYTRDLQVDSYVPSSRNYAADTACVLVVHHRVLDEAPPVKGVEFSTTALKTTFGELRAGRRL